MENTSHSIRGSKGTGRGWRRCLHLNLCALALVAPWGDLMRIRATTSLEADRGLSTFLALTFLGIGILSGATMRGLMAARRFRFLFVFVLAGAGASLISDDYSTGIRNSASLVVYGLIGVTVAGMEMRRREQLNFVSVLVISATLMCLASIVDYYRWVDLPRVNERSNHVEFEALQIRHASMQGPFYSRTKFAVHLALVLPAALVFSSLGWPGKRSRILWMGFLAVLLLAGILASSRGLFLSAGCVGLYVWVMLAKHRRFAKAMATIAICLILGAGYSVVRPETMTGFAEQVARMSPQRVQGNESDYLRFIILGQTVKDLATYPLGQGFTRVRLEGFGKVNPHSNLAGILHAGGLLGPVLVIAGIWPLVRRIFAPGDLAGELPVLAGLIGFSIYGMAHENLQTLLFWVFLGIGFGFCRERRSPVGRPAQWAPLRTEGPHCHEAFERNVPAVKIGSIADSHSAPNVHGRA